MPRLASTTISLGSALDQRLTEQDFSDAQIDRARIDGGFSFALAAFLLGLGLLAILERVGLPDELLRGGVIGLIFAGLIVIAVMMRTMRPADFYAGGRRLPAAYAGLVFTGTAFGLFLPFLPPLQPGISFVSIALGFCFGFFWLLFGSDPILRRSGAFSVADLIGSRFPILTVRLPIVLLMAFCAGCIAVGGFELALRALMAAAGVHRAVGAILLGGVLVLLIVPAGLAGVMWISAAAAVIAIAALALPLGFGVMTGLPLALPIFGDQSAWANSLGDLALVTGVDAHAGFEIPIVIAFSLGVALLAPFFGGVVATRDRATAWRSGLAATVWLLLSALLIAATLAGAILALKTDVSGRMPAQLPAALLDASDRGQIALCGLHSNDAAAVALACSIKANQAATMQLADVRSKGIDLLTMLPALRGSEPTFARLAAAFVIILGMGLAACGTQSLLTSLCHDFLHPKRRMLRPVSRRLAVARAIAVAFIAATSYWLASHSIEPRFLFTLALMLSAALVAPLFVLSCIPQATPLGAFAGLCVAAFVMGHFFVYNASPLQLGQLATDAAFAATDALAAGFFISFLPRKQAAKVVAPAPTEPTLEAEVVEPAPTEPMPETEVAASAPTEPTPDTE
jgi:cation/acetate symporter